MNIVPNQTGKGLEETLAGFNSSPVKATLRALRSFRLIPPLLHVLEKPLSSPPVLCHSVSVKDS